MVILMSKYVSSNEQLTEGVNLLVSILLRYPEIGTLSFDSHKICLKLKFMLTAIPSNTEFSTIKHLLLNSITAYRLLEGRSFTTANIDLETYEQTAMLSIIRDVHTISKGELALLITLLRENFQQYLIVDSNDSLLEEDLLLQEQVIEDMLVNIKINTTPSMD